MNTIGALALILALIAGAPSTVCAASAVFDGDPVDPNSGLPYEILPGFPLVLPGPDGLLGTADDSVDPLVTGDIDLVVRAGSLPATSTIPFPTARRGRDALPVGTAGSSAAGGVEIPFSVFLSDGAVTPNAPAGHLLAAADMDAIPVVVAAFADLDGDGFIGPTNDDPGGSVDNGLEIRELEPVGRAATLFRGGVARGSIAVRAGLPASRGGLTVPLCAIALTGPFDSTFFEGNVPRGPAISTALPFTPQRDLSRLIRDRASAVGPDTTLQDVVQFAAVPQPRPDSAFALRVDGSNPTIDAAVVNAQPAVAIAFRDGVGDPGLQPPVTLLTFGTRAPSNWLRLRLLAVDRWGNPADPGPAGLTVSLQGTSPLRIFRPFQARFGRQLIVRADGVRLRIKVPHNVADGTNGTLTAEQNGVVIGAVPYSVDSRANRPKPDIEVPSPQAQTIQSAIDTVLDRKRDGLLVVDVGAGLYHEDVTVNRSVILRGHGSGQTVIVGNGIVPTVSVTAPNVAIRELTVVGGSTGIATGAPSTEISNVRVLRNVGAGITLSGLGTVLQRSAAHANGGDGLLISGATDIRATQLALFENRSFGARLIGTQAGELVDNQIEDNGGGGVSLAASDSCILTDNQCVNNVGAGLEVADANNNAIVDNLFALNDADGLSIDSTNDNLVSRNVCEANHGYGLFVRRSTDDFGTAPAVQAPPGDNQSANNRKGNVFVRPD